MRSNNVSLVVLSASVALLAGALASQNSTAKLRERPSATAARAGSAVAWRSDLAAACAASKQSGKPVFWYVPTVGGSPMDRKPEIDRYMMAGPFCWPALVSLLNGAFEPVRATATGKAQKEHDLVRGKFIEPGFLVLDGDGKELLRQDRITTMHPEWFMAQLRRVGLPERAAVEAAERKLPERLAAAWAAYRASDLHKAEALLTEGDALVAPFRTEADWLLGCVLNRTLRADRARKTWLAAAAAAPDDPFAWKCAAEAEGHGPFVRGFEDYLALPPAVIEQPSEGTRAPAGVYDEEHVRAASVRFLLAMQQPDGSYIDSLYDFGGTDSLPNVYTAVTALVGLALLGEASAAAPGPGREAIAAALNRIRARIAEAAAINGEDRDEILWAHVYRIVFLCRWRQTHAEDAAAKSLLQALVDQTQALQPQDGAWFHEYANPFATASTLLALWEAKQAGAQVDDEPVRRGITALLQCRADNGGFTYGFNGRGKPRVNVAGAAGRMPLCELALVRWGKSDADQLAAALAAAFEHHGQMESVRKYDDHASPLGYGGFFFWYDMLYRTEAIAALPDGAARKDLLARQRQLVLSIPEIDGCFVDSHELGRCYGTAMGLLCLAAIRAVR